MSRSLLVIDIQNEYFPGGLLPLWQAQETEARIVDAIGRARAAGDKVILVRHVATASGGIFDPAGTGVAIRPAILEAAGDAPVVTKHFADSFQETDLMQHLTGIGELLVCGMMTQNCVVFTALSRLADPFEVRVVSDLCTAPIEVVHHIAISALGSKTGMAEASAIWPVEAGATA